MAGVYIKGYTKEFILERWINANNLLIDEDDLMEVPDHGDLIDRDVFVDRVTDYSRISTREIGKALRATPTVIPADKEEV